MILEFEINPQLDIPIYQQIVDKIRAAVKMGQLNPGQQLPTVQEMAQQLSIARGTIKRAYDELEHLGLIEKIQGRGTFICYQPANSGSRKEQAMVAIDEMLDKLEGMGFSPTEINIFLTLKQRERTENVSVVKAAVVECNPETLSQLSDQLRAIKGIELYSYLLDSVQAYPYKLDEDMELVLTTAEHGEFLQSILPDRKKIALVAMRLSPETLSEVLKIRGGASVGIVSSSKRFADLLYHTCKKYTRNLAFAAPCLLEADSDLRTYLSGKDAVLLPKGYEKYCEQSQLQILRDMEKKGKAVLCSYDMDEGSFLHLEEKLQQLRQGKSL